MFDKSVTSESHPQYTFSGNHCSDHLTFLNAFHNWLSINNLKSDTEIYCERNKLYQPSLTSIKNIMVFIKGNNNTNIHRTSISACHKMDFQSPFFIFANKAKFKNGCCYCFCYCSFKTSH